MSAWQPRVATPLVILVPGAGLDLLSRGNRVPQIAKALFLSSHTVRNHIKAMFRKAGVHSQGELVSLARSAR